MKIEVNREKYWVIKNDKEYDLPRKEFSILNLLCLIPGKVHSRNNIFKKIWSSESKSQIRTVDVHIVNSRKKLGNEVTKTIKSVGYKCTCK